MAGGTEAGVWELQIDDLLSHRLRYLLKFSLSDTAHCPGPPDAPKWCRLTNQTSDLVSLVCNPGYNGGLTQQIHMEFFTSRQVCIANITGHMNHTGDEEEYREEDRDVYFTVTKLPADQQFNIVFYASNQKGKSVQKYLTAHTLPVVSGETGKEASK